jgi:hypothetical protein
MKWLRDRRRWKRAQKLHILEHAAEQPLTLTCKAVGHLASIDDYTFTFDSAQRRHFLAEYRPGIA